MLLVATDYLDLIGFVGGAVAPMYMNFDYKIGTELFWWVHPNYRKAGVGAALLSGIEAAAKAAGCKFWTMLAMQCMAPERAGQIYEAAGYRWVERSYSKEL
jgi:GNAT superfamily N-acetyltransferase